ncbi:MAG: pilus assembly protein PilP [Comamonas sp.]
MRLLMAALAVITLTACSGEPDGDLQEWVQAERATAKPRITPLAEPKQFIPQDYKAGQGMDPFSYVKLTQALRRETAQSAASASLIVPEQSRRKEELEAFPLDTMAMVGSLDRQGQRTALLRVDKLLYQVRSGQYLGQNYGRIVNVNENSIQLRELIQDASGDWVEKMTNLDLQEGKK